MKKYFSVLVVVFFLMALVLQKTVAQSTSAPTTSLTNIIPKPVSVKEAAGVFTFYHNTIIETPASLVHAKQLLQSQLSNYNFAANKQATIIKYISRWRFKDGVCDLKKARWFLDKLIEQEEKFSGVPLKEK